MNHIYGLVWSATRQAWVVVAEIAAGNSRKDSASRRARRRLRRAMIAAPLVASIAAPAFAQTAIMAPGQNGRTYVSPNGTTVVDITSANAAGVSHNQFTQYNVSNRGLVLNNTTGGGAVRNASQLAGSVSANAYSSRAARLIINEVTSTNPSTLAGFTEVVGQRADVVVANPYGITCLGCGFINTDRVTLTTGAPRWNTDGSLAGFNVQQGNIAITGNGLNASAQQILDLVSRSVTLSGAINAQNLGISAGTGTWDYTNRAFSSTGTGVGAAPSYAIDASALGAMYANQIRLIANESGVGVRLLGDVAAQVGDVTISASGQVMLNNRMSAQGNLLVASTGGGITMNQASLASGKDLTLSGSNVSLDSGSQAVSYGAAAINATGDITNAGSVQAAGNLHVASTGGGITNQGILAAGQNLTLSGSTVSLDAGSQAASNGTTTINATGNITNAGAVQAQGSLQVASTGGDITFSQGTMTAGQDLSLKANNINLDGGSQAVSSGTTEVNAANGIVNAGVIQAQNNLTIAGSSLDNSGNVLSMNGDTKVTVANALTNEATNAAVGAGTANLAANGNLQVTAGSVNNAGLMGGSVSMNVQTTGDLVNTSTGSMQTLGSLALNAGNWFHNSGSVTSSASGTVSAQSMTNDVTAELRTAYGLNLALNSSLQNSGIIQAGTGDPNELTGLSITLANIHGQVVNNTGGLIEGGGITVNAASLTNQGGITAGAGGSTMTLRNLQNLAGADLTLGNANSGTSVVTANNVSNLGTIQTSKDLTFNLGSQLTNGSATASGKLLTGGALTIQGTTASTPFTVNNYDLIDAQGTLSILGGTGLLNLYGSASTQAAKMIINAGSVKMDGNAELISQGDLDLQSNTLQTTTGTVNGATTTSRIMAGMGGSGTGTVSTRNDLDINGLIYSKGDLNVTAPNITVESTAALAALNNLSVTANAAPLDLSHVVSTAQTYQNTDIPNLTGNVTNYGTIYAGNTLSMRVPGLLTNAIKVNSTTQTISNPVLTALQIPTNAITTLNLDGSVTTTYTSLSNGSIYTYSINSPAANTIVTNSTYPIANPSSPLGSLPFSIPTTRTYDGVTVTLPAVTVSNRDNTTTTTLVSYTQSSITTTTILNLNGTLYVTSVTNNINNNSTLQIARRSVASQGEITAGNNMNIVANTLINNSDIATLNPGGTMQIVATTLRNEVQGGDQRVITTNYDPNWMTNAIGDTGAPRDASGNAIYPGVGAPWRQLGPMWDTLDSWGNLYQAENYFLTYWEKTAFPENAKPVYNPTITAAGNASIYFQNGSNLAGLIQSAGTLTLQGFVTQASNGTSQVPSNALLSGMTDGVGNYLVHPSASSNVPVFTNDSLQEQLINYTTYRTAAKEWIAQGNLSYTSWGWCSPNSGGSGLGYTVCSYGGRGYGFTPANIAAYAQANPDAINAPGARIYANTLAGGDFTLYNQATVAPAAYDAGSSSPSIVFSSDPSTVVPVQRGAGMQLVSLGIVTNSIAPPSGTVVTAPPTTPAPQSTVLPGLGNQTGWTPVSSNVVSNGSSLSFGGVTVNLPTNGNGMFVLAKNPQAGYLIEGNPLYMTGSTVGSDYLMTLLGFSTDATTIRLGNGSYETWLVEQELIAQTGSMLLKGYSSVSDEMRGLMKDAAAQAKGLGLVWGQAPTDDQLAKLKTDIVWMVKSVVDGKEVLVPVVYLCKATKDAIQTGAIIQANGGSLTVKGQGNNGTVTGVTVTNVGGGKGPPSLFPSVNGGQNFNDETFQIIKAYLQSTDGGKALGISDVQGWLAKNQNDPTALGKVLPYAIDRFMSLATAMQHGDQGALSANDVAFVNYVAEYAKEQRLAAIQQAMNDYDSWKQDQQSFNSKNKTLTSLFGNAAIPPQWIVDEAQSGILLGDTAHQQQIGTMVGEALTSFAAGGTMAGLAGASVAGALTTTVASGSILGNTFAVGAAGSGVVSGVSMAGPIGIFLATAAIAGMEIYNLVEGLTFRDRLVKMQQTVENHSATDFNYWFGQQKGGALQMSLSIAQLMTGANPNMTSPPSTSSN